jgi:alpha-tubulin suppressor-like RCC1 family protein
VWGWGTNFRGSIGDNTTLDKSTPVSVLGAVKTFCVINDGKLAHVLAIDKNGRAWGWGYNNNGQVGNNAIVSQLTPVSVLGAIKTFCKISCGDNHSAAIDKNGRAWGWGYNSVGQLGNNAIISQRTPVSVLGAIKTFCQISSGPYWSSAIDKNGRAWGWGDNFFGQLGNNAVLSQRTPVSVLGAIKTFCQISCGDNHTVAIDKNGRAWGWGYNSVGQLGNNSLISQRTPVSVLGAVKTFCQIAAKLLNTVAVDKNGRTWVWGSASNSGTDSDAYKYTPKSIGGAVKTFCQIFTGSGGNSKHGAGIDKNGRAWGWGYNNNGQVGINTTGFVVDSPNSVLGAVKTFCKISGGGSHTSAIDKNGRAWGWGYNLYGQLGNNAIVSQLTPVSVLGAIKTFCKINPGQNHTAAIDKNGRAWCWGRVVFGQVGDNQITTDRLTPVSVLGAIKTFCEISGGGSHTLAIDKNGRAWGWGYNNNGQVGDNSPFTNRLTPVSVLGAVKTFCQISGGSSFSAAIDKNGRAWCWGSNGLGQLGDDTTTQRATPVSVLGAIKTFCKISGGGSHISAIDKNGRVWCWGYNIYGQLGDNTIISKQTPVSVLGAVKTFCQILSGTNFTLAMDNYGKIWGWGDNSNGALGIPVYYKTPVQICEI